MVYRLVNKTETILLFRNRRSRASSTGGSNNETSLPDRLANALRALRPGILAHSSSSSSANKKVGVVDADDVVYFPNVAERNWPKNSGYQNRSMDRNELPTSLSTSYNEPQSTQIANNKRSYERNSGVQNLKTLDDIRQLYKSVPNFFNDQEEDDESAHVKQGNL
jgi:hypothetical protein